MRSATLGSPTWSGFRRFVFVNILMASLLTSGRIYRVYCFIRHPRWLIFLSFLGTRGLIQQEVCSFSLLELARHGLVKQANWNTFRSVKATKSTTTEEKQAFTFNVNPLPSNMSVIGTIRFLCESTLNAKYIASNSGWERKWAGTSVYGSLQFVVSNAYYGQKNEAAMNSSLVPLLSGIYITKVET